MVILKIKWSLILEALVISIEVSHGCATSDFDLGIFILFLSQSQMCYIQVKIF